MDKLNFYTASRLKPTGWLLRQLNIQSRGLAGNLDRVWNDVSNSKWIGGNAEGWERVPYWLDGFIPLAYLLEDRDMISRVNKYITAIISAQREDGWICPCNDSERAEYDLWAVILISKVLTVYYECSGDESVIDVIYKTVKNFYDLLKSKTLKLFNWGKYRWFEGFIALNLLSVKYNEWWITDLAHILKEQGADYDSFAELWKTEQKGWRYDTHIVNIAMCLKSEAVSHKLLGESYKDIAEKRYGILKEYHGTPTELFIGDECLGELDPTRGTELCSVVELMYSYEILYAYTGDTKWLERLEVVAFNGLPATISEDMWTHQYDQLSNQTACIKFPDGTTHFGTNKNKAHLFGLEPEYGCCTANFGQGWPKLALSAFMYQNNTIINTLPIPSILDCHNAKISLETNYPFENTFKYTVVAKSSFTFKIRIPSFAKNITVNGKPQGGDYIVLSFTGGDVKEIFISYECRPYFEARPHGLYTVKCGSLVFSLPIAFHRRPMEYTQKGVERKFPYCDYELIPNSPWNYAFASNELEIERHIQDTVPFSSKQPAITVKTKCAKIDWGVNTEFDTLCAKLPNDTKPEGATEDVSLYPYGCAKLRMTELPKISLDK